MFFFCCSYEFTVTNNGYAVLQAISLNGGDETSGKTILRLLDIVENIYHKGQLESLANSQISILGNVEKRAGCQSAK